MFVVCKLQKFEFEPKGYRFPFPKAIEVDPGKMLGYLPVYQTREEALSDFPDSQLMEIRKAK